MLVSFKDSSSDLNSTLIGSFIFLASPSTSYGEYQVVFPIQNENWFMTLILWIEPFIDSPFYLFIPFTSVILTAYPSSNGCLCLLSRVTIPLQAFVMLQIITQTVYSPFLSMTQKLVPKSLNTCPNGPQQSAIMNLIPCWWQKAFMDFCFERLCSVNITTSY